MYKLFTIEKATELLPFVDESLRGMQDAVRDIRALRLDLSTMQPFKLEARNKSEEMNFLIRSLQDSKAELDRLGVHLQDLDAGLVDFPSRLGAEVILLCYKQGADAITHYHRLGDTQNQQPLPPSGDPASDPTSNTALA